MQWLSMAALFEQGITTKLPSTVSTDVIPMPYAVVYGAVMIVLFCIGGLGCLCLDVQL
jgi:hypothetical protein